MPFSAIDCLVTAILMWGARAGWRQGFGTAFWSAARWLLVLVVGAALAVPTGQVLTRSLSLPAAASPTLAYILVGTAIVVVLEQFRQRFEAPLVTATPAGSLDRFLGLSLSLAGTAAAILIAFALLHPWHVADLDWNPRDVRTDQAIEALLRAVVGSLRRLILEESWIGSLSLHHLTRLLLPVPGTSP